jgi:hypothetical protein
MILKNLVWVFNNQTLTLCLLAHLDPSEILKSLNNKNFLAQFFMAYRNLEQLGHSKEAATLQRVNNVILIALVCVDHFCDTT